MPPSADRIKNVRKSRTPVFFQRRRPALFTKLVGVIMHSSLVPKIVLGAAGALAISLFAAVARGDIASNCTISPGSAQLLTGSVPPQPGVEIFVYATASTGVEYTFECDATEQPASVVILPAEMKRVTYDSNTGKLSVVFTNVPYVEGSNVPAPPGTTTFSIALVAAGPSGIPVEMRGSWMATNIPPFGLDTSGAGGWELLPPSQTQPFFGYRLNGPEGSKAFFQMFIPESLRLLLEQALSLEAGAPVTVAWSDLAVFNNNEQASLSITPQTGGGALVDILVEFSDGVTEFEDSQATAMRRASSGGVDKRITVREAETVSLTADDISPAAGQLVTLYGWVKDCIPGERVKLTSNAAAKAAKVKGGRKLAAYKKKGWKRVILEPDCRFSQVYTAKKTDVFKAMYKPKGAALQKSDNLKITVAK